MCIMNAPRGGKRFFVTQLLPECTRFGEGASVIGSFFVVVHDEVPTWWGFRWGARGEAFRRRRWFAVGRLLRFHVALLKKAMDMHHRAQVPIGGLSERQALPQRAKPVWVEKWCLQIRAA